MAKTYESGVIYGLVGPDGIRYIGQTVRPKDRYSAHRRLAEIGDGARVYRWWRSLAVPPKMVVIETVPIGDLDVLEIEWIAVLRKEGVNLTNHRSGGSNGIPDAETRLRMSRAQRKRPPMTPETRAKLSAFHSQQVVTPAWKAAISEGLRNSEKAKRQQAKVAASQIGAKRSPESRARMAAAQRRRYENSTLEERKALTANANVAWRSRAL